MSVSEQVDDFSAARDCAARAHGLVNRLISLECWYVSAGGAVGTTFQLALGRRIPRDRPLDNQAHSQDYRDSEGEANLLVWCDWRLDGKDEPVTSCDDTPERVRAGLERIVGHKVTAAILVPPAWDLGLEFDGGLILKIFADHVPGDPSFDGNWDLSLQDVGLYVGPGAKLEIEPR